MKAPFRISGFTFDCLDVLVVSLTKDGRTGLGEAAGVYYKGDTPASMLEQLESLRGAIETGVSRSSVQGLLPPGGARNALDCALWDLDAKLQGSSVWRLAGLEKPKPLITTFTCGVDSPDRMASTARKYVGARAIKLKLFGDSADADRVRAVRDARDDVWLAIDANRGFTPASLEKLMPVLIAEKVALIEQPFPVGHERLLDGLHSPIHIAADESIQSIRDLEGLIGRVQVINIKLDKCGGLTEALAMVKTARELRFDTMVGNMMGTSLAMAPAFLVGQLCSINDLDGTIFLKEDRASGIEYRDGLVSCTDDVWGSAVPGALPRV